LEGFVAGEIHLSGSALEVLARQFRSASACLQQGLDQLLKGQPELVVADPLIHKLGGLWIDPIPLDLQHRP
jgi:hypothetical protein